MHARLGSVPLQSVIIYNQNIQKDKTKKILRDETNIHIQLRCRDLSEDRYPADLRRGDLKKLDSGNVRVGQERYTQRVLRVGQDCERKSYFL